MISIIIPSLDSPHIKEIVKILKNGKTDFKDMEIIIVGKDRAGLLAGEDVIFVDTSRVLTPAENRNIGLKLSRGEIVIFLDSDCIPQDGWLTNLLKSHGEGKNVVGGAMDFKIGNFWALADNIIHFYNTHPSRRSDIIQDGPLPTANLSISREVANQIGPFSENLVTGEDFEYSMKIREKGYALNFERSARVIHLTSRSSLGAILTHSMAWAKNSIHLRNRFSQHLHTPFFMRNGVLLYLLSPLIACLVTFKIFLTSPALLRYWYTIPVIYLAKLIWSITGAEELIAG